MVKELTLKEFEQMEGRETALIDFSATWCNPCQMLAPILKEVSDEYEGKMNFYSVDVSEEMEFAKKYGVTNIPALIIVEGKEKKDMTVGFMPKPLLKEFIDKNL